MSFLQKLFKKDKPSSKDSKKSNHASNSRKKINNERIASRKGELGEYKINIELDQLPKDYKYLSDVMIENPKAKTGYSQIDHIVLSPYGIFVIETKNYQGTVYGGKDRKTWSVNGKFNMMNPFHQNYGHIQALKKYVDARFHDYFISLVSFTRRCTFKVEVDLRKITSNELIIYDLELSEFINRKVRSQKRLYNNIPLFTEEDIANIYDALSNVNIKDAQTRELHVKELKKKSVEVPKDKCVVCNKSVSDKVKAYCLANKRFDGKVYCYEHQKGI
ncbi:nuclease-related domain-containing protein [Salirhabdus sp. Marseille-P4669]|uniref:nuclease-related domain-containing protein n=1 Tax=Salirhabdus sp. Marseille-P4669 TaxID=2042310 RepID=UPI000C7CBD37|nr:nuclease-related domain-containing protein [Salirhabdus sp. Marseille-P4669]